MKKLKLIKVGQASGAIVIPRDLRKVFGFSIGDEFRTEFSKNRIVLTKLTVKQKPKEPEPIVEEVIMPGVPQENKELLRFKEMITKRGKLGKEEYRKCLKTINATNEEMALLYVVKDTFICPTCGEHFQVDMSKEGDEFVKDVYEKAKMFMEHAIREDH